MQKTGGKKNSLWRKIAMERDHSKSRSIQEEDLSMARTSLDLQVQRIQREQQIMSINTKPYTIDQTWTNQKSNFNEASPYNVSQEERQKLQNTFVPVLVTSNAQIIHSDHKFNHVKAISDLRKEVKTLKQYINFLQIETLKEVQDLYGVFSQNIKELKMQTELLSARKLIKLQLQNKRLSEEIESLKNIITNWNKEYFSLRNQYEEMKVKIKSSEKKKIENTSTNSFKQLLKNPSVPSQSNKFQSANNKTFYGGMKAESELFSDISKEKMHHMNENKYKTSEEPESRAKKFFKHKTQYYNSSTVEQMYNQQMSLKQKIGKLKNTIQWIQ